MKQYDDIGMPFEPDETQKKTISKAKEKRKKKERQSLALSRLNHELIQFPIAEHELFAWTDDKLDIAVQQLVAKDILRTKMIHRDDIVRNVIDENLILFDASFIGLEASNLLKTFYNKHNEILKRKFEGNLDRDELKPYQTRLLTYIEEKKILWSITSLDSDQS